MEGPVVKGEKNLTPLVGTGLTNLPNIWGASGPLAATLTLTQPGRTVLEQETNVLKFTISEMATKINKIFTVNLTVCSNRQIDIEDFVNFCGLLRKHEHNLWYQELAKLFEGPMPWN